MPGSDTHFPDAVWTSITRASSAYRVHDSAGSSSPSRRTGSVRQGSSSVQMPCRDDRSPVRRPARTGEFANAATSTGPSASARRQRRAASARSAPMSRQTWTDAVEHIIASPASGNPPETK
ncbi:hypothetical protein BJF79_11095 [Actinomadura sp. CNU-125]|nr:hypothetical protein BJF79_11095 [Actinomadura sp. CNU-125]